MNQVPMTEDNLAELESLGDSIASVLTEECTSLAVHAFIDGKSRLDRMLWDRATELGWLAIGLPEKRGGLGLGARGLALLLGQLGGHAAPGAFLSTLCAAQALVDVAPSGGIDEWLEQIVTGKCRIAIPAQIDYGDPHSDRTRLFLGDADSELILAPLEGGSWGLYRQHAAEIVRQNMWDRTRTVVRVNLGEAERVARIADGAAFAQRLKIYLGLGLAADSLAGSRTLLDKTIAYMKERRQFDRPIASFQALKHRVADMKTMIVAGAPTMEQALSSVSDQSSDAELWSSLAKAKLTEDFAFISQDCLQLHGGVGFTWEFDVHIFLKRARLNEMLLAPGWIMRDRAAQALAAAVTEQRSTLDLPLV